MADSTITLRAAGAGNSDVAVKLVDNGDSTYSLGISLPSAQTKPVGAPTGATGQQGLTSSSQQIIGARATRRSVTIYNIDASLTFYIKLGTGATSSDFPLTAGASIPLDYTGIVTGIAPSGAPLAAYIETYD